MDVSRDQRERAASKAIVGTCIAKYHIPDFYGPAIHHDGGRMRLGHISWNA
jgi:hypothetical protein